MRKSPTQHPQTLPNLDNLRQDIPTLPDDARETIVARAIFDSLHLVKGWKPGKYQVAVSADPSDMTVSHAHDAIIIGGGLYTRARSRGHDAIAFLLAHEIAHYTTGDIRDIDKILSLPQERACREMRSREYRADREAYRMVRDRGYDPRDAMRFLDALRYDIDSSGCHPSIDHRISELRRLISGQRKRR